MTKVRPDKVKLPSGARLMYGQLIQNQRTPHFAAPGFGRYDGKPKNLKAPETVIGQKRQTAGALHPYLHGQAVNDETADKLCHNEAKSFPIHNGMGSETPDHRGADYGPDHGSKVLRDGGKLDWDHKHGDVDKAARLPSKLIGR
jgi:hypothetical protein